MIELFELEAYLIFNNIDVKTVKDESGWYWEFTIEDEEKEEV